MTPYQDGKSTISDGSTLSAFEKLMRVKEQLQEDSRNRHRGVNIDIIIKIQRQSHERNIKIEYIWAIRQRYQKRIEKAEP